ncbi:MAG: hypothetical protein ACRCZY_02120 [Phocaeicola sp.]
MWFTMLLIAIAIGAFLGYASNGSSSDAAAGGCMGAVGCLNVLFYIATTVFSLWLIFSLFVWLFG